MMTQQDVVGTFNFYPQNVASCKYRLKETTLYRFHLGHIWKFFFLALKRRIDYCTV